MCMCVRDGVHVRVHASMCVHRHKGKPRSKQMAEDELGEPAVFSRVHLHGNTSAIVPHRNRVGCGINVHLHRVHALCMDRKKAGKERKGGRWVLWACELRVPDVLGESTSNYMTHVPNVDAGACANVSTGGC